MFLCTSNSSVGFQLLLAGSALRSIRNTKLWHLIHLAVVQTEPYRPIFHHCKNHGATPGTVGLSPSSSASQPVLPELFAFCVQVACRAVMHHHIRARQSGAPWAWCDRTRENTSENYCCSAATFIVWVCVRWSSHWREAGITREVVSATLHALRWYTCVAPSWSEHITSKSTSPTHWVTLKGPRHLASHFTVALSCFIIHKNSKRYPSALLWNGQMAQMGPPLKVPGSSAVWHRQKADPQEASMVVFGHEAQPIHNHLSDVLKAPACCVDRMRASTWTSSLNLQS